LSLLFLSKVPRQHRTAKWNGKEREKEREKERGRGRMRELFVFIAFGCGRCPNWEKNMRIAYTERNH